MAPNLPDTSALARLLVSFAQGDVRLVDEHAQPLAFDAARGQRCWAHLRDATDGRVYVHELNGSSDLLQPNYQALLGLNV